MSSVNKVIIVGNLGADPEVKRFDQGSLCNIRIACSESWKDKNSGERREKTEWVSVVIRGDGLVHVAETYLRKGSKVYIEGKLSTRKWQDQSGNDRYTTEVLVGGFGGSLVMLDGPQKRDEPSAPYGDRARADWQAPSGGAPAGGFGGLDDETIPF